MNYDIAALKRKVINMYPYFGSVAASVEYIENENIDAIETGERTIYYNPKQLAALSDSDQIFLLSHELCHIAFKHDERGRDKEKILWGTATDAVITQLLKRDGLEIISGGVDRPEAIEYDAETYYEILLESKLAIDLVDGSIQGNEMPEENSDKEKPDGDGSEDGEENTYDDVEFKEDEEPEEVNEAEETAPENEETPAEATVPEEAPAEEVKKDQE